MGWKARWRLWSNTSIMPGDCIKMENRKETLEKLITLGDSLETITGDLETHRWDSENALVTLNRGHLEAILKRYIAGEISESEVEDWANTIEAREDIGFETEQEDIINSTIFELANPLLTSELTHAGAQRLIEDLQQG